jgi:hypothetical protein
VTIATDKTGQHAHIGEDPGFGERSVHPNAPSTPQGPDPPQ